MHIPNPTTIHSILVRAPNWIGDAVMATSIFQDLKKIFPHAKVSVLAPDHIVELLQNVEGIDVFIPFSREKKERKKEYKRLNILIKKEKPDLGILLTRSFSSAWMFFKAGIPHRLGYSGHLRSLLLTMPLSLKEEHEVLSYRHLLSVFQDLPEWPDITLSVTDQEKEKMQKRLESLGISSCIIMNPGAAYGSSKCWPITSFQQLTKKILQETPHSVVFIGDQKSVPMIENIMKEFPKRVHNLAGKTTLRELLSLIFISHLVVTNDSGPMHIAAALKKPLVALFGSTNPFRTGPWGIEPQKIGTVICKQVSCWPCYKRECPKDFSCMKSISIDEVFSKMCELL